jgi:hypothetical protein
MQTTINNQSFASSRRSDARKDLNPSARNWLQTLRGDVRSWISRSFYRDLLCTPKGRAYVLTQMGTAESTDEGAVFDRLLARVADEDLRRMIRKHAEDEERHASMFFDRAAAQGIGEVAPPDGTRVLELLDAKLNIFSRELERDEQVLDAYLVLQVIEERAIEQFSMIEPVMREYDPASADVLAAIGQDEVRHLKYCRAITKRYAVTEAARKMRLAELRTAEATAFQSHQFANMDHLLRNDYLPSASRTFWRVVSPVLARQPIPMTRFASEFDGEVALAA